MTLPAKGQVARPIQSVISYRAEYFGNKCLLGLGSQTFPSFATANSYDLEERNFDREVRVIPIDEVSYCANGISSQVIYNIKVNGH